MRVLLWNVHGLTANKLADKVFLERVAAHDVVVVTETHCTLARPASQLVLPGFRLFDAMREGTGSRVQGGVTVYVREDLARACTELKGPDSFAGCEAVWLRFAASRLNREGRSLLVGAFYASPADATVYRQQRQRTAGEVAADLYAHIRDSISALRRPTDELLMLGDFNARVGGQRGSDGTVRDMHDVPDVEYLDSLGRDLGVDLVDAEAYRRVPGMGPATCDKHHNSFGLELLDLCRQCELVVLNGRAPGDAAGACTYISPLGGASMIDLCLASPALFPSVKHLRVMKRPARAGGSSGKLFSDNCPVSLALDVLSDRVKSWKTKPRPRFDVARYRRYAAFFDSPEAPVLQRARAAMQALAQGERTITEVVASISNDLFKCMQQAFGGGTMDGVGKAGWWNDACAAAKVHVLTCAAELRKGAEGMNVATAAEKFTQARREYNRAKRAARRDHELQQMQAFVTSCRTNPGGCGKSCGALPPRAP